MMAWTNSNAISVINNFFIYIYRTELRCLNRKDLIEALAKDIPAGTIRFGCRIAAIHEDPSSSHGGAVLTMADGTTIKAKVVNKHKQTCSHLQYHSFSSRLKLISICRINQNCRC